MAKRAKLILEDGTIFGGEAFGAAKSAAGEVVFATGMVGYEQSLTDPSYCGQILVFTYPLIGNWGVPPKTYWESSKIQVSAVVISDLTTNPHHHMMETTLDDWLRNENVPAIVGVDTRRLTQKLREKGVMLGKIVVDGNDLDFWNPNAENLVAKVSPKELRVCKPETRNSSSLSLRAEGQKPETRIGLLNCGAKESIKRNLLLRGVTVYELPWNFDPFKNKLPIDALVISNGPGDPKMAKESIAIIKEALKRKIPTFGICLGSQLLALAAGGNTFKLKFGHRAQNQPTIQVADPERSRTSISLSTTLSVNRMGRRVGSKRCFITTQNHGYAVSEKKLPDGFRRWFYNANDNTNEGIIHQKLPVFSVQFHPEATPGPFDTEFLFDYFMEKFK